MSYFNLYKQFSSSFIKTEMLTVNVNELQNIKQKSMLKCFCNTISKIFALLTEI